MTALATGLAVFACAAAAISVLTRRFLHPAAHRAWAAWALIVATLLISAAAIFLAKTGGRDSSTEWQAALLLAVFALFTVALTIACIGTAPARPFWSQPPCPRVIRGWLSRVGTQLPPVGSRRSLARALASWVLLPFCLVAVAQWLAGQAAPDALRQEQVVTGVLFRGALATLTEEWWFRWLPVFFFARFLSDGRALFPVVTLLWVALHPLDRLLFGGSAEAVLWALPGWCLSAVFYYRVWRGPFFWTAFPVHFGTNVGVIFVSNCLGVL